MIRRSLAAFLAVISPVSGFAACLGVNSNKVAPNTMWAVGPNVYNSVLLDPTIGPAIYAARDAWDVTNAANRIGDWNNAVSASDCPTGQPSQLGALNFSDPQCPTAHARDGLLAFVDVDTKSITVNTAHAFSTNPLPGQHDLQSVLAHEFGHVLGFGHMSGGQCNVVHTEGDCSTPNLETMSPQIPQGTCLRDLAPNDISNANSYYP
jgi:hypothetical protein